MDSAHAFQRAVSPLYRHMGVDAPDDRNSGVCRFVVDGRIRLALHGDEHGVLTIVGELPVDVSGLGDAGVASLLMNNRPGDDYPPLISVVDWNSSRVLVCAAQRIDGMDEEAVIRLFDRMAERTQALERLLSDDGVI